MAAPKQSDDELVAAAQKCVAEMRLLLDECHKDFRRRSHQAMNLPAAIRKLENALNKRAKDPDPLNEYLAQWSAIRRCSSLVQLDKTVNAATKEEQKRAAAAATAQETAELTPAEQKFMTEPERQKRQRAHHRSARHNTRIQVDIVEDGREWLHVRLLPSKRLAMQMTESGWSWGCHEMGDDVPKDEWEDISLTKRMTRLVAAAKLNPNAYRPPRIRLVLPIIGRNHIDFRIYFDQLARMDPDLEIIVEDRDGTFLKASHPPDFIQRLIPDPLANLTSTLTLDHTTLVDIISDITHFRLESKPWQSASVKYQIEEEKAHVGGYMNRWLYPALSGRKLVVTKATVDHLYEVLETVGTPSEKERAKLLVAPPGESYAIPTDNARERFQELSVHPLPENIQIPFEVDGIDWTSADVLDDKVNADKLPQSAVVSLFFNKTNLATIIRGWATGNAIITSNRDMQKWANAMVSMAFPQTGLSLRGPPQRPPREISGPLIHTLQASRYMLSSNIAPRTGNP